VFFLEKTPLSPLGVNKTFTVISDIGSILLILFISVCI
jgi:hypothetical protein